MVTVGGRGCERRDGAFLLLLNMLGFQGILARLCLKSVVCHGGGQFSFLLDHSRRQLLRSGSDKTAKHG